MNPSRLSAFPAFYVANPSPSDASLAFMWAWMTPSPSLANVACGDLTPLPTGLDREAGLPWVIDDIQCINPVGVVPPRRNPVGVVGDSAIPPRVARSSQPWALGRNPFGIRKCPPSTLCRTIRASSWAISCRPSWQRTALSALAAGLAFLAAGCAGWRPEPVDIADPVWRVQRGQAVWRPAGRDVELAGEILGATTEDGRGFVQFSKSPMVLAEVRVEPGRWHAAFPFQRKKYQGVGSPPSRLAWAQWIRFAQGQLPEEGWSFEGDPGTQWKLSHPRSGEWIEGVGGP